MSASHGIPGAAPTERASPLTKVSLNDTVVKLWNLIEQMDRRITLVDERVTATNELIQIMDAQLECLKKMCDVQAIIVGGLIPHSPLPHSLFTLSPKEVKSQ